jgi:D-alanyl-D-alanine dipeptidase
MNDNEKKEKILNDNNKNDNNKNDNNKNENEKTVFKIEKKSIYTLICLGVIIFILIIIISTIVASSGKIIINPIYDNSDFVIITEEIPEILTELRYYTSYNFIGKKINGYEEPVAIIKKEVIESLKNASRYFMKDGYLIKIWDSYRPQKAVDQFYDWLKNTSDITMKDYFYPNIPKSKLNNIYISKFSNHSKGYSIDLTLVNLTTGKEIDFGTGYDFFDEMSETDYYDDSDDNENNDKNTMRQYLKK